MIHIIFLGDKPTVSALLEDIALSKRKSVEKFSMCFQHPIKGTVKLFKHNFAFASYRIEIDTKEEDGFEISLAKYPKGDWRIVLEWEYHDKHYNYQRKIAIT